MNRDSTLQSCRDCLFFPIKYGKHLNLVGDADGDGITYHRGEKEGLSRRKWSIEGDFKKLTAN